jgi:hypothetical protein
MTIDLELPQELELAVRRRARESGREVGPWLVGFLQENVVQPEEPAIPRLTPATFPDEELGEELEYRPVELPIVGSVKARFVDAGPLAPQVYPDDEQ